MIKKESIAIVPGSFDPITNGHLYIIKEARKLYDKIYVAVMIIPRRTIRSHLKRENVYRIPR